VYLTDDSNVCRLALCIANLTDGIKIAYVKRYIEKARQEIAEKIKKAETAGQTRLNQPSDKNIPQPGKPSRENFRLQIKNEPSWAHFCMYAVCGAV